MEAMEKENLTAYCGVDCSACTDFLENRCPGCRNTKWTEKDICMPVKCCRSKGISFCGECSDFPCQDMKGFYQESESHKRVYLLMKNMKKELM